MDTFMEKFTDFLGPIADKLNRNRYLAAIRDGFFGTMSIIIIGSMFLLFANFPSQAYKDFMAGTFGVDWAEFFNRPYDMTMNIMSIFVIIGMAKSLANHYEIDSIGSIITSLVSFFILTPTIEDVIVPGALGLPMANFGAAGLFLAMISTIITVEIMHFILAKGWKLKMPDSVPTNVATSFEPLVPAAIIITFYTAVFFLFKITSFGTAQAFIFKLIQAPLTSIGSSLPATIIVQVLATLLFAFGIHGPNIVGSVMNPIWLSLTAENADAYKNGISIPNIVNAQFDANFVKMGGCGTTIGLAILLAFFAKSDQYKALGKLAIAPSIFNINEPLIFGIPVVLNPIIMIPFILSPIIFCVLSYVVMKTGIVPYTNGVNIPWTMPPIISGFLLSGWKGAVWQVVEIILSVLWYFPFFKMVDNKSFKLEQENKKELEKNDTAVA